MYHAVIDTDKMVMDKHHKKRQCEKDNPSQRQRFVCVWAFGVAGDGRITLTSCFSKAD